MINTIAAGLAAIVLGGWELGSRAPAAPARLDEFAFLIGCYRIDASRYDPEQGAFGPTAPTYWNGRWALGGWAIYDEWFNVQIPGRGVDLGRGANLRMIDPETGVWTMVWTHTQGLVGQDLRAEMRGDRMVMWQVHPRRDDDWKAEFEIIDADHWVRIDYRRAYGTDDWVPGGRLSASRVDCADVEVP